MRIQHVGIDAYVHMCVCVCGKYIHTDSYTWMHDVFCKPMPNIASQREPLKNSWGHSSVSKGLALREPEYDPRTPCKNNPVMVVCSCIISTGMGHTGGSLGSAGPSG